MQTLPGHIVPPIPSNMALWSLSYEIFFYLVIYTTIIFRPQLRWFWLAISLIAGLSGYMFDAENRFIAHLLSMLAFSFYWLVGHFFVLYQRKMKLGGVGAGVTFLVIGMTLSRTLFGAAYDYYDFLRLAGFALCSGALISTLVAVESEETKDSLVGKPVMISIGIFAVLAMWIMSGSNMSTKLVLTALTMAAIATPTKIIESSIFRLRALNYPLVFLGSISYALYVTHVPLIIILDELLGKYQYNYVIKSITILGAAVASAVFLELHFQKFVRRFLVGPAVARNPY